MSPQEEELDHINYPLVSKTHTPMYLMHKYWARKPHNVVAEYIKHYSQEGDIVLDPFVGSGVTVIEALRLGRKAVGIDLDPISMFITQCTLMPIDLEEFNKAFQQIKDKVRTQIDSLYITQCPNCQRKAVADAIIWHGSTPTEIRYSCVCGQRKRSQWKKVDKADISLLEEIKREDVPYWYPKNDLIWNTRINVHRGEKVSDLFTKRNLIVLSIIHHEIEPISKDRIREIMKFTFSSALPQASKMVFVYRIPSRDRQVGGWATRGYWIPKEYFEINAWNCFEERFKKILRGKEESNQTMKTYDSARDFEDLRSHANVLIKQHNVLELSEVIPPNSVDYIFTDPPYGDAVPYLELDHMWNSWLEFKVNFQDEIIISNSPVRNKTQDLYERMLNVAFSQIFEVLKPGKYMTVTFHSTDIKMWTSIIKAVVFAGFDLEKIIYQPPARASAKGLLAPYGSAVGDYYIRFSKPAREKLTTEAEVSQARYKRVVIESAKRILAERGEPTPYTYILNGIIVELRKEGVLLSGKMNPDEVMREQLNKEFILIDVVDNRGKKVGQKWWFKDPSSISYLDLVPLTDRVETAVVDVLNRKVKVSFDDIQQEIFIKFPNALTPETQSIKGILSEYANKAKDGKWMLKPIVRTRQSDHARMIYLLACLGKKAGFDIWIGQQEQSTIYEGKKLSELCTRLEPKFRSIPSQNLDRVKQIDILWYSEGEIHYSFEVEHTTAITEAVVRASNIPDSVVERFIVVPEEREALLHRKMQEPLLKENITKSGWKFIFYNDLADFYAESKRKKRIKIKDFEKISKVPKLKREQQLDLIEF